MCQGATYAATVQAVAQHENEYQAAVEAILTPQQREKRREVIERHGSLYVSRYRD